MVVVVVVKQKIAVVHLCCTQPHNWHSRGSAGGRRGEAGGRCEADRIRSDRLGVAGLRLWMLGGEMRFCHNAGNKVAHLCCTAPHLVPQRDHAGRGEEAEKSWRQV